MSGSTETYLICDRETRPPCDGIKTICGERFGPTTSSIETTRVAARRYNWTHAGTHDYCGKCSRERGSGLTSRYRSDT